MHTQTNFEPGFNTQDNLNDLNVWFRHTNNTTILVASNIDAVSDSYEKFLYFSSCLEPSKKQSYFAI